jgi:hypothetical protein
LLAPDWLSIAIYCVADAMRKADTEDKSQWIAQDTRKRVTAAVLVTACRIVAPMCEDENE